MRAWKEQSAAIKQGAIAAAICNPHNMSHAISVWTIVQALLASPRLKVMTGTYVQTALTHCWEAMQLLGFQRAAECIRQQLAAAGHGLSDTSARQNSAAFHVGMSEADFQLRLCGDRLQRDVPANKDNCVVSFNPDIWQREVLDTIDARASCVICAPTSSGKTFISSYCIDRVLKESRDGIVVFVAPTKALVNQTAAQVSLADLCTACIYVKTCALERQLYSSLCCLQKISTLLRSSHTCAPQSMNVM